VDSGELATSLRRYDGLGADQKRTVDKMMDRNGDTAVSLLDETICNSPCDSFTEVWHELKRMDTVSSYDATTFRNRLLDTVRSDRLTDRQAADLLADVRELARDENIDVTDVINRNDVFARELLNRYGDSDSIGTDTLRRIDQVGEIKLPDAQLQTKYKHADDFGVTGNYSPENREAFKDAIAEHIVDPDTRTIEGTYHNNPVTHLYNPNTGNNIVLTPDGEFLTGWELSPAQRQNVLATGDL